MNVPFVLMSVIVAVGKIELKYESGVCDASSGLGNTLKSSPNVADVELPRETATPVSLSVICGAENEFGYWKLNAGMVDVLGVNEKVFIFEGSKTEVVEAVEVEEKSATEVEVAGCAEAGTIA